MIILKFLENIHCAVASPFAPSKLRLWYKETYIYMQYNIIQMQISQQDIIHQNLFRVIKKCKFVHLPSVITIKTKNISMHEEFLDYS